MSFQGRRARTSPTTYLNFSISPIQRSSPLRLSTMLIHIRSGSPHMFPMAHKGSSARPDYSLPASVHSILATASVNNTSSKKENVERRRVDSETEEEIDIMIKNKGISRADPEKCIETLVSEMAAL